MKKKTPVHSGGRKTVLGPRQAEARTGRDNNRKHKSNFKSGAFVKNDPNAGRPNGPLIPSRENPTPGSREEKS
jgi:hypothetical protein